MHLYTLENVEYARNEFAYLKSSLYESSIRTSYSGIIVILLKKTISWIARTAFDGFKPTCIQTDAR